MPKGSSGIDIDDRFNLNLKDYKVIKHDLNLMRMPFKDDQFDTLLCSHVLEHLNSPHITLNEFKRIVKPNGIIILAVPNARCIFTDFYKGEWAKYHINVWDYHTFKVFLEVHNIRIIRFLVNHPTKNMLVGKLFQLIPFKIRWEDIWFVCKNIK